MCVCVYRYVVAATTIWSGASYVYTKGAVRILTAAARQAAPGGQPGPAAGAGRRDGGAKRKG